MYEKALKELAELQVYQFLPIEKMEFWLLKYSNNFRLLRSDYSCYTKKILPCYCSIRNGDCLFIEIYKKLEKISSTYRYNEYCRNELSEYKKISHEITALKDWLFKNEDLGLNELVFFDSFPVYHDLTIRIHNGNLLEEYVIKIAGINFEHIYGFMEIFNNLFFKEKVFLERYENWKKITGYIE